MEILFKDSSYVFYIEDDILDHNNLGFFIDDDLINVPHLKDVPPLFSILSSETNSKYYAYYRHNDREIIRRCDENFHFVSRISEDDIIDYTEYNINKLLNGDII